MLATYIRSSPIRSILDPLRISWISSPLLHNRIFAPPSLFLHTSDRHLHVLRIWAYFCFLLPLPVMFTALLDRLPGFSSRSTSSGDREDLVVMMTLGKCQFAAPELECSCKAGKVKSTTGVLDRNSRCLTCDHLMSFHGNFVEPPQPVASSANALAPSPPPPTLSIRSSDYPQWCPRRGTVERLAALLEEQRIVHVRGTPASGKSLLAGFLHEYLIDHGERNVIYFDDWSENERPLNQVLSACLPEGRRTQNDLIYGHHVVILDEAQYSYRDRKLWYTVMKTACGVDSGARFCIFSSYGSPTTGAPRQDYLPSVTPPIFRPNQRVSLMISPSEDTPDLCLFFQRDEYHDVVDRFCRMIKEFTLHSDLQDYMFSLTNGHPGMVSALLNYTREYYRSHLKRQRVSIITLNHVREILNDDRSLSECLQDRLSGRALPTIEMIGNNAAGITDVLLKILRDGHILYDANNEAINTCFRMGFVHTELTTERKIICVLPSPLHGRFIEYSFGKYHPVEFPIDKYGEPGDLCQAVIRRFSRSCLCQIRDGRSGRSGTSGQARPLEAVFQDEFYRAYWHEVPGGGIASECVVGGDGRVDFFVMSPGWGIELVRDSDRLVEHLERFKKNGAYYTDIMSGTMKDWIVLDFRHSFPKKKYPNERRLWRVVFNDDYSRVQILDCDNRKVIPEFVLANQ